MDSPRIPAGHKVFAGAQKKARVLSSWQKWEVATCYSPPCRYFRSLVEPRRKTFSISNNSRQSGVGKRLVGYGTMALRTTAERNSQKTKRKKNCTKADYIYCSQPLHSVAFPPSLVRVADVLTYRSADGVSVFRKIRHTRPPILKLVCLGEFGSSAVAKSALRQNGCNDMHATQIHLNPLFTAQISTDGRGRAPSSSISISIESVNKKNFINNMKSIAGPLKLDVCPPPPRFSRLSSSGTL